jgi:signal transduction histidine kinase
MAHEIRNPLGIIRMTAETLHSELAAREEPIRADHERMFADLLAEVDRVNELIARFLSFAKPGDRHGAGAAEIVPVVHHAVRLCQKTAAHQRVDFAVEIGGGVDGARTPLPAASLQQVLFNLLINALESMNEAGRAGTIRVSVSAEREAKAVVVTVSDRGAGMTPSQLRRATEPFVTTKEEGTGLGLSITKNLLASVQGRLEITSRPGEGTEVRATLPLQRDAASVSPEGETES